MMRRVRGRPIRHFPKKNSGGRVDDLNCFASADWARCLIVPRVSVTGPFLQIDMIPNVRDKIIVTQKIFESGSSTVLGANSCRTYIRAGARWNELGAVCNQLVGPGVLADQWLE